MILFSLVHLLSLIEKKREYLHRLAMNKGLSNPEVLTVSQEMDGLINSFQQIAAGIPK